MLWANSTTFDMTPSLAIITTQGSMIFGNGPSTFYAGIFDWARVYFNVTTKLNNLMSNKDIAFKLESGVTIMIIPYS